MPEDKRLGYKIWDDEGLNLLINFNNWIERKILEIDNAEYSEINKEKVESLYNLRRAIEDTESYY